MVPYDQGLWLVLTAPWEIEICTKEGVGPGIPTLEQSLDPVPGDIPEATLPREGPCEAEGRLLAQGPRIQRLYGSILKHWALCQSHLSF